MASTDDSWKFAHRDRWLRWYFTRFPIERGKWRVWERVSPSLKRTWPKEIETTLEFGMRMKLDLNEYIDRFIYYWGCFEPNETWAVQRLLKRGDTFVDAGANIGYFTLLASSIVGTHGRVMSFEPIPSLFSRLAENVELNGATNIEIFQAAVSDESGTIRIGKSRTGGSATYSMRIRDTMEHVYTVPAVTLEQALGKTPVQFIKLDIEGAEVKAINGYMKVLRSAPVANLFVEVSDACFREMGNSCEELHHIMGEMGYTAYGCQNRIFSRLTLSDLQTMDENKVLFSKMPL